MTEAYQMLLAVNYIHSAGLGVGAQIEVWVLRVSDLLVHWGLRFRVHV